MNIFSEFYKRKKPKQNSIFLIISWDTLYNTNRRGTPCIITFSKKYSLHGDPCGSSSRPRGRRRRRTRRRSRANETSDSFDFFSFFGLLLSRYDDTVFHWDAVACPAGFRLFLQTTMTTTTTSSFAHYSGRRDTATAASAQCVCV